MKKDKNMENNKGNNKGFVTENNLEEDFFNVSVDEQKEIDSKNIFYMQNREEIIQARIVLIVLVLFVLFVIFVVYRNINMKKADIASQQISYETTEATEVTETTTYQEQGNAVAEDEGVGDTQLAEEDYTGTIFCWGDSFSENIDEATNFYGYYIYEKLALMNNTRVNAVFSAGAGDESLLSLAGKFGNYPLYTSNFTIPAEATPVELTLKSLYNNSVVMLDKYTNPGLNPCYINGIAGNLTSDGEKIYFQRLEEGNQVLVANRTVVISNLEQSVSGYISVFFFGNEYDLTPSATVNLYKSMIEATGNENYIIVGSLKGTKKDLEPYEKAFENAFGQHFINFREYLCSDVFDDYDIKITSADLERLKNDQVPESFMLKDVRLNDKIASILGETIYNRLIELGII